MNPKRDVVLALSSGALAAASMPGPDLGWLAWLALVPLFWAFQDKSPRQALKLAWLGGAAFYGALLYWLYTLWDWASVAIIPGYLALVGVLSLYWGIFGALFAVMSRRLPPGALVPAAPALWVTLEYLRSLTRFGFTWGQLADALYRQLEVVQLASLAGPWGLSFLVVLVNLLLFLGMKRRRWSYPVVAAVVVALVLSWGWTRLRQPLPEGPELGVSVLQPNIPQRIRSDSSRLDEFTRIYRRLLDRIPPGAADLVVLPESALPTYLLSDPETLATFTGWARGRGSTLVLGTYSVEGAAIYNSTAVISPDGEITDTYRKNRLVPFSTEYFPGIGLVERLGLLKWVPVADRLGRITPGQGFNPVETRWGPVATPICFESSFSDIGRRFVGSGARLIVTLTNDAWFKGTWALPQHFAKGVFRAVENGRFFVQAANTGVSGVIDPRGRVLTRSPIQREAVLNGTVRLLKSRTVYTHYGDWFVTLSLVYLGMSALLPAISAAWWRRPGSRRGRPRW